jgi:predicted phage-related endonuclease
MAEPYTFVLVEAKTSANDDEWGRPGTDEIPTHYLTQCYWAMHVSGIHETRVPVLTSRLRFEEYIVKHDPEVGRLLETRCREFYDSLSSDTPPPLDDSVSTFECMKRLHPDIEPGLTVEVPQTLAVHFVMNAAHLDILEQKQRLIRSELFDLAGQAQYLECNGVRVARRQSMGSGVSLVRVAKSTDQLIQEPAS